jgi:hypothetical protein
MHIKLFAPHASRVFAPHASRLLLSVCIINEYVHLTGQ